MKKIAIIGASGHGKVVADIAQLSGYENIVFLDDNKNCSECAGFPVIGDTNTLLDGRDVFVAIGHAATRKKIMKQFADCNQPVLIHPRAVVAKSAKIGPGSIVMAGAVVNPNATIGCGCIINTLSSVDHDCSLGDFVHIAVGAHVCGAVSIGDSVWIGAGATVVNNICLCDDCFIGAGTVVIKDIVTPGTYIKNPAVLLR